jgi:short-subunit dehydrogenase
MSSPAPPSGRRPVALVTGPTSGLGRVFADRLAARGHDLVLVARDETRLKGVADELAASYGVDCEAIVADLADRDQLSRVEQRLADEERPVDLLVNNAGFGLGRKFLDNTVEQEQALLDVLVTAPMRLMHAVLGPMTRRGSGGIINVSSVAGLQPRGSYSAAKAYLNRFGEWAAHEYRRRGVRIITVLPGFTRTEFHERMGADAGQIPAWLWMSAEDVVDASLRALRRGGPHRPRQHARRPAELRARM